MGHPQAGEGRCGQVHAGDKAMSVSKPGQGEVGIKPMKMGG